MGKAARLRRQRGLAPLEKSAYARVWRASHAAIKRNQNGGAIARFVIDRLPHSRIYRYREWDIPDMSLDDLGRELYAVHFPFPLVFLDAGNLRLGETRGSPIDLIGILCAENEKQTWGKPTAIALTVVADGTDEWWSPILIPLFSLENGFRITRDQSEIVADDGIGEDASRALLTMLGMLECMNVTILPALDPPVPGHVANGVPHYDVVVRHPSTRREPPEKHRRINWSHSWEVAANFAHYTRGPIFEAAPLEKRILHPERGTCVRVWRRSHVRGSGPFVPKVRIVGGS